MQDKKIRKTVYLTTDITERMDTYTALTKTTQSAFIEMVVEMFLRNLDRVRQGMLEKARKERQHYDNQIKSLGLK